MAGVRHPRVNQSIHVVYDLTNREYMIHRLTKKKHRTANLLIKFLELLAVQAVRFRDPEDGDFYKLMETVFDRYPFVLEVNDEGDLLPLFRLEFDHFSSAAPGGRGRMYIYTYIIN